MSSEVKKSMPTWAKGLLYSVFFVVMVVFAVKQLPSGGAYSTDLTLVGEGKPALVLVYDVNNMAGHQMMDVLKPLRERYKSKVLFLVADLGTPEGRSFARHYNGSSGSLIVLNGEGYLQRSLHRIANVEQLEQVIVALLPVQG